jgi:hypothetical protein
MLTLPLLGRRRALTCTGGFIVGHIIGLGINAAIKAAAL